MRSSFAFDEVADDAGIKEYSSDSNNYRLMGWQEFIAVRIQKAEEVGDAFVRQDNLWPL